MKVLVQWSMIPAQWWEEVDSSDWGALPADPVPVGGEVLNGLRRYITAVNVHGTTFTGYDHYAVEDIANGGCRVTVWSDDPKDLQDPPFEPSAVTHEFYPLAPDLAKGGLYTSGHVLKVYAEPLLAAKRSAFPIQELAVSNWGAFTPPDNGLIKHGIWMPDDLYNDHYLQQPTRGWREWTDGLPAEMIETLDITNYFTDGRPPEVRKDVQRLTRQRPLGLYIKPTGTQTYFPSDTSLATGIHAALDGHEYEAPDATGTLASLTGGQVFGGSEQGLHYIIWTTASGEPNDADWPDGEYRCQLDVTSANLNSTFGFSSNPGPEGENGHFARVDSGLTADQETNVAQEAYATTTGVHLFTTAGGTTWSAGSTADRWECLLAFYREDNHGTLSLSIDVNQADTFTDGPWPSGGAGGRVMSSLAYKGGLAGEGGIAGPGGGLAG